MDDASLNSPFPETRWTVVLRLWAAGHESFARPALARLCADYWYPL